jgi:hypothetical protein
VVALIPNFFIKVYPLSRERDENWGIKEVTRPRDVESDAKEKDEKLEISEKFENLDETNIQDVGKGETQTEEDLEMKEDGKV